MRSASQHYEVMTLRDIADLPVRDVLDTEAWCFLWAVSSMLPQALWVLEQWGFSYSGTAFVWAKLNPKGVGYFTGLGHTTRKNAEICLLGKRGKPSRNSRSVRELIVAPVRDHSQKPDEAHERIEQFCDGPRLEIFARQKRRGWHCRGDQVERYPQS